MQVPKNSKITWTLQVWATTIKAAYNRLIFWATTIKAAYNRLIFWATTIKAAYNRLIFWATTIKTAYNRLIFWATTIKTAYNRLIFLDSLHWICTKTCCSKYVMHLPKKIKDSYQPDVYKVNSVCFCWRAFNSNLKYKIN